MHQELMTPAEVASAFRVNPKTVYRWARAGKLTSVRTLGNHRRYRRAEVEAIMRGETPPPVRTVHTITIEDVDGVRTVMERIGGIGRPIAREGETTDPLEDVAVAAASAYGATYVPAGGAS